jgi:hypothetical protein
VRAGAGGFGYLKEWIWWAGLLSSKHFYIPVHGMNVNLRKLTIRRPILSVLQGE